MQLIHSIWKRAYLYVQNGVSLLLKGCSRTIFQGAPHPDPQYRSGCSLKRDCRTRRSAQNSCGHTLNNWGCQTHEILVGPSLSPLKAKYFGNVSLHFLFCSKIANSLCYFTPMSKIYLQIPLPINPVSDQPCFKLFEFFLYFSTSISIG